MAYYQKLCHIARHSISRVHMLLLLLLLIFATLYNCGMQLAVRQTMLIAAAIHESLQAVPVPAFALW
jgi:hypothetical protein